MIFLADKRKNNFWRIRFKIQR